MGSQAQNQVSYFADTSFHQLDSSRFDFPYSAVDSLSLITKIKNQISELRKASYLAANVDSLIWVPEDSLAKVHLFVGEQLVFGELNWSGVDEKWKAGPLWRKQGWEGKIYDQQVPLLLAEDILKRADENGHPLGKLTFQNKKIIDHALSADIVFDPGPSISWGGIDKANDTIINKAFLEKYLGIKPEQMFQMSLIQSIDQQINQLPFLSLRKAPQVKLLGTKAYVDLDLKATPASRFDFIIGILPNVANERLWTISGELTADLKNKLKQGEEFYFHFQQLKPETQRIDFNAKYPYLLQLPFGVHGSFNLYRNGTESRDLNSELGIQYRSGKYWDSQFYISYQSSRLIEIDTVSLFNTRMLPPSLDVRINNLGARISYDQRDYRLNPRKGLYFAWNSTVGLKNILPNLTIQSLQDENISFAPAYDTLDLNVLQLASQLHAQYFLPLRGLSTLLIENKTGLKWSQSEVFFNEYYRIGGSNILRGFDEESIRAQYYTIMTAEFRYLLALNSYFSAFFDYGVINNPLREQQWDFPFGFGIGLRFQTTAGIFGIDVALGRELDNPLDFRNTKTHFGFVSLF